MTTLPSLPALGATAYYGWDQAIHNIAAKANTTVSDDSSVMLPQFSVDPAPPTVTGMVNIYKKNDLALYVQGSTGNIRRIAMHWGVGASLPATGTTGDSYYHTSLGELYLSNDGLWHQVEPTVVASTAARDAISTTYSGILYSGFLVYVTATGITYRWNGSAWAKAFGVPELVISSQVSQLSTAGIGAGFVTTHDQLVPAHNPGLLELRFVGGFFGNGTVGFTSRLEYPSGTAVNGSTVRMHNNGIVNSVQPIVSTGYIASGGTSQTVYFRISNDAGSNAVVSAETSCWFHVWLHGAG